MGEQEQDMKVGNGEMRNGTKVQKSKTGNEKQDANSYQSLPGDVGRSSDQRFWKWC